MRTAMISQQGVNSYQGWRDRLSVLKRLYVQAARCNRPATAWLFREVERLHDAGLIYKS